MARRKSSLQIEYERLENELNKFGDGADISDPSLVMANEEKLRKLMSSMSDLKGQYVATNDAVHFSKKGEVTKDVGKTELVIANEDNELHFVKEKNKSAMTKLVLRWLSPILIGGSVFASIYGGAIYAGRANLLETLGELKLGAIVLGALTVTALLTASIVRSVKQGRIMNKLKGLIDKANEKLDKYSDQEKRLVSNKDEQKVQNTKIIIDVSSKKAEVEKYPYYVEIRYSDKVAGIKNSTDYGSDSISAKTKEEFVTKMKKFADSTLYTYAESLENNKGRTRKDDKNSLYFVLRHGERKEDIDMKTITVYDKDEAIEQGQSFVEFAVSFINKTEEEMH